MPDPPVERVSTIELFFDLVFVFTITQSTSLLANDPTALGVLHMILVLGNVWWMYAGYAWLTNAVLPREPGLRLLMLLAMTGFLVVALAIPRAFGASGIAFGIGYLVVTVVHTGMFLRSTEGATIRAMGRLGSFNAITALMLLLAGFTDGALRWGLWAGAFVLHWITPYITNISGFAIRAAHFVERHGLIVLIALGGIVALAAGINLAIAHPGEPMTAPAAWFLGAGVAAYVFGLVVFRWVLGLGPIGLRLIIAGLAVAAGVAGLALSPEAELGALVAVVGGGAVVESRMLRRRGRAGASTSMS